MDYQSQPAKSSFATAALVMGILSLVSLCTIIGPLIFGSLGIIFAILSRRPGQKTAGEAIAGIVTSVIGYIASLLLIIWTVMCFFFMHSFLTDPEFREQINYMYEETYGSSFEELIKEMYGSSYEELEELMEEMNGLSYDEMMKEMTGHTLDEMLEEMYHE